MSGFTHLHLHTEYSLLDGACRIKPLVAAAKELGQTSLAITDHGSLFGAIDFYKEAKKQGIKPIIGCEVYVAARTRFDKVHGIDSERYHLVLLAENDTGYRNLIKIVSDAWTQGFYTKPRVDKELLEKYHEGIIALSACLAGEIPQALLKNDYEQAVKTALWYKETFGENNFFIEIQNHGIEEELRVLPQLVRLAREQGIGLVATNDTHYIEKRHSKIQQILICIQTNHILGENTGLEFEADEFYLKSESEMRELFADFPEAVDNTAKIAERCNVEIEFGNTKLPNFDTPNGEDHFDYFASLCREGFIKRYGENAPEKYKERLEYELQVVNKMGYTDYYLIVNDFVQYAKNNGIPVGPGRGSGAGSIAAYCIGITGIDPMKYNLLFERFLNPERVSMPDFDIDFCYERRQEVIDYVISKYGSDHVSQIVTFGTLAAKAAVRDVGRVMGLPYATVDSVAKLIPFELNITLDKALTKSADLRKRYDTDETVKELIDNAMQIEGMPRHASKHAAGVVITRDPVKEYVPLALSDDLAVTQYTMVSLEELGLLKMDFLGLKTLTVISDAEKAVRKTQPDFDIEKIPLDDIDTYKMFSSGQTLGVFQFESAGMRSVLTRIKPKVLEDLIAVVSLYRPGPMDSIDTYIENRRNPEKTSYKADKLRNIMEVTHGCLIYQEQVMQVFRELAGYSYGRADVVRRAMSKKKHDVMEMERKTFIEGAVSRGVEPAAANSIFEDMSSFASYAFNKS
ncbi:MAG: DNA polymerase III subunit alpha, partial [Clostridia bacterium]|nr:DNA polymerase III subunit alpha [Clostridia bacterium]